ncbi:MAG TPA: hypothetical protein VGB78_10130 [Thermoplasmata archaeon]
MSSVSGAGRSKSESKQSEEMASPQYRKLQRILRGPDLQKQHLSGGSSLIEQRRMSDRLKEATLSPHLVIPPTARDDDVPLFQCTQCDMIVKETDPYCPFCGAIFADGPLAGQEESFEVEEEKPRIEKPRPESPSMREPFIKPEKFDVFEILDRKSKCKELTYREAQRGFAGSARLLEDMEHLISEIGSLGTDTSRARRLLCSAWEACRDGDWNLVSNLAKETEDLISPSIPDLVRSEISKAREHLIRAKAAGVDISPYVLMIKSAMRALHENQLDEALGVTKELTDSVREDSLSWK